MTEVPTTERDIERFRPLIGDQTTARGLRLAGRLRDALGDRIIWNVNSTAAGGGVAEMLRPLLGYVRGTGVDCRWVTIEGDPDFFRVTKRLHHSLHGSKGDGSKLEKRAHRIYKATTRRNLARLLGKVNAHDVVILHDPQTAGLADGLIDAGATVIWRCHIGHSSTDGEVEYGWRFLAPYLERVPAFVFSRRAYVPEYCDHGRSTIITPSIDAFSPKNQHLSRKNVEAILAQSDLVAGNPDAGPRTFTKDDGTKGKVGRKASVVRVDAPPPRDVPLIVQVSRWDPLKDPTGVLRGFAALVVAGEAGDAHLVLAGPDVSAVTDDPEGAIVLQQVVDAWRALPKEVRRRVHLASLPMDDLDENAAMVNALQRHATIVVQKSLHEGFGLTVTEAMWKARPVVASAVGGIQDQITNGVHGLLLKDPADVFGFARSLSQLLAYPETAKRLGEQAKERVRTKFLGFQHLVKYARLINKLDREMKR